MRVIYNWIPCIIAHCRHSKINMHSKSVYFTQNSPFGGMSYVGSCAFRHIVRHKYVKIFRLIPHVLMSSVRDNTYHVFDS